jgi:hypothetical protein
MNKHYIKVFGERNCGTNYLQGLLLRNFNIEILPGKVNPKFRRLKELEFVRYLYFKFTYPKYLGWKHQQIDIERIRSNRRSSETLFLVLIKNPYSFLLSLYKKPYHYKLEKGDFDSFLQASWKTVGFEHGPKSYLNPIVLWNEKNKSYLEFKDSGLAVELIKYEDLVADPAKVFDHLSNKYNLPRKPQYFSNITRSMKGDHEKDFNYYKNYYLQQRWKEKLNAEQINVINQYLDLRTLQLIGYEPI